MKHKNTQMEFYEEAHVFQNGIFSSFFVVYVMLVG